MTNNVIFDMDGVIFDTERFYLDCLVPAAEKVGLNNIEEVAYQCIGLTETETEKRLIAFFGKDAPLERLHEETARIFLSRYEAEGLPEKPGVRPLLQWLKEQGIRIALASSTKTEIVTMEIKDAGLWQYFDVVIGGDQAENSKPAPDIFLKAAEKLQADPAECYVIEDSFNGVRAAFAAGTKPLMVPDLLQPDEEIRKLTEKVFPSLYGVLEYLKEQ